MSFTGHLFLGLLEGGVSGLVIALTAMGLSLVFGVMRIVNVAHGEFFMLGAVFAWYFSSLTGSFYPALVAGLLARLWLVVTRTRLGLYMRATQQDREIAQAFGVPTERVYAAAFALGAVLAAIAGVLIVPVQQAHYLMGLDALLLSFMAV